jgi:hypothetical protein
MQCPCRKCLLFNGFDGNLLSAKSSVFYGLIATNLFLLPLNHAQLQFAEVFRLLRGWDDGGLKGANLCFFIKPVKVPLRRS